MESTTRPNGSYRYVALVPACLYAIAQLDHAEASASPRLLVVIGLTVGIVIAVGGAWKYAPAERFHRLKFFRSPIVTPCAAVLLSAITNSYLEIAAGAIGYERASVETYQNFFFPTTAPGKFAGTPVLYPEMLAHRRWFVPAFVGIWLAVAVSSAAVVVRPVNGVAMGRTVVVQDGM